MANSMSAQNLSAVFHGKDDLRLENRAIPAPAAGEVLIRVHSVSLCGSDVHFLKHGAVLTFVPKAPFVLGHESSGAVEALGDGVDGLQKGDRVALEPGIPCRRCEFCLAGSYNLCPSIDYLAAPPYDGALCRYITHPADFCYKLPDSMSFEDGALLEPLGVVLHAVRRAGVTGGQNVFVAGAGAIGLLCIQAAKAFGAVRVVVSDVNEKRLELAKAMGADGVVNVGSLSADEISSAVQGYLDGRQPEVSFECTGMSSACEACLTVTRPGGVVALIGVASELKDVPLASAVFKGIDVRGVCRVANTYPTAIRLIESGQIDLSNLTRAHYSLERVVEGFERCSKGDVAKVFIDCN